jgi:type IV pilus assembly protein PilA
MSKRKIDCNKCGGRMRIDEGGVVMPGVVGPTPIVKLFCDACVVTRFESRTDIEAELAAENVSSGRVKGGAGLAASSGRRTGLAIAALVLGILSFPLLCAFGAGIATAIVALVLGIVALVKVNRYPNQYGGKGMAIAGIATGGVVALMIPIWAAIAIPSLLRARIAANESAAKSDLRTVASAQAAYASQNGGYYDKLECLANPQKCVPGVASGFPMIDGALASPVQRSGYTRELFLGPPPGGGDRSQISPSSATRFAYVAVPALPGRSGIVSFCIDDTGVLRADSKGERMPSIIDGRCPESWSPVGH